MMAMPNKRKAGEAKVEFKNSNGCLTKKKYKIMQGAALSIENSTSPTNELKNIELQKTMNLSNKSDRQAKACNKKLCLLTVKSNNLLSNKAIEKTRNSSENSLEFGCPQELNDGTDSGVEVIRTLSSNGSSSDRFTPIQSCASSLLSYSSEPDIDRGSDCGSESSEKSCVKKGSDNGKNGVKNSVKGKKVYIKSDRSCICSRKSGNYENGGTSESCSETSSTHESTTPEQLNRSIDFKRPSSSRMHESKKFENGKSSIIRRSLSSTRSSCYDKSSSRSHSSVRNSNSSSQVNSKSLAGVKDIKSAMEKSERKGNGIKSEEGRWTASQKNHTNKGRVRISDSADSGCKSNAAVMSSSMTSSLTFKIGDEVNSNALDKYGTLPRRPKKRATDQLSVSFTHASLCRSSSVSREPSLNRTATLRRQQSREKENSNNNNNKYLPPYPRSKKSTAKTIIFHEVSVQTLITKDDIDSTSSGVRINDKDFRLTIEKETKGIQTEGKERLKKIEEELAKQTDDLEKVKKENEELKEEKRKMTSKICKLLGYENGATEFKQNGLEELESHFQAVGLTVIKQQEELSELRHYQRTAHRDLEKSLAAQKNLLQQQQEIEEEYSELQEFLQAEKTALSESLLDTEEEIKKLKEEITIKQSLLDQQQEECKHLVRICEQRRQENLSLEAKLAGLDQRSRDVLVQQGAAVSAAAVALSGLGARLDALMEQLASSCNITDGDLEDIIFHNEAYTKSEDNSPTLTTPKPLEGSKRTESFLQVILSAIRTATHSPFSKNYSKGKEKADQNSDTLGFFDAEADPCLNFENLLEETSSSLSNGTDYENCSSRIDSKKEQKGETNSISGYEKDMGRSDSLQNLSEAILNRQMAEKNERSESLEEISPIKLNTLVDQIIEIDNLVTKLLKAVRIIQLENEKYVEELQGERTTLTEQLHKERTNRQKLENNLQKLQQELTEARSQLNTRISKLEEVKALCGENQRIAVVEMQKRFAIIDTALGALNSVQDVVNRYPPLAQLRQDLEGCSFGDSSVSDVNANSQANSAGLLQGMKRSGAVLTTAI